MYPTRGEGQTPKDRHLLVGEGGEGSRESKLDSRLLEDESGVLNPNTVNNETYVTEKDRIFLSGGKKDPLGVRLTEREA